MAPIQKTLLFVGIALVVLAFAWPLLSKLPFGRLPGDLVIQRENGAIYFPLTTMALVSIFLTVIFRIFGK